jgi:hypothetical protein
MEGPDQVNWSTGSPLNVTIGHKKEKAQRKIIQFELFWRKTGLDPIIFGLCSDGHIWKSEENNKWKLLVKNIE